MKKIKILGIPGSIRKGSFNKAALETASELTPAGTQVEVYGRLGDLPPFNQDLENNLPEPVADLKAKVAAADAILFSTPEYNYSIPGILKNAIDWASRPYGQSAWEGKPVGIMSAATGRIGGARAQMALRKTFVFLNMIPLNKPEILIPFAQHKVDSGSARIIDEDTREHIRKFMEALTQWTIRMQAQTAIPVDHEEKAVPRGKFLAQEE